MGNLPHLQLWANNMQILHIVLESNGKKFKKLKLQEKLMEQSEITTLITLRILTLTGFKNAEISSKISLI